MKKFSIFMGIVVFFFGVSYSQSITVTSPNNGTENWKIGTKHDITWNAPGVSGDVTLKLYRGGTDLGRIASNAMSASLGTYSWKITSKLPNGASVTPGSNYKVMVRHTSTINDLSNQYFTISAPASTLLRLPRAKPRLLKKPEIYPDLYISYMAVRPENPSTGTFMSCFITIKNKGSKESKFCALELEVKHELGFSQKLQDHIPAITPGSYKKIVMKFKAVSPPSAPKNKLGGQYTNKATIDPFKTSGEIGMGRLNNRKSIKYHVKDYVNRPDIKGCVIQIRQYKMDILGKNVGLTTMPPSSVSLYISIHAAGFRKELFNTIPELKPGDTRIVEMDISIIRNVLLLYA